MPRLLLILLSALPLLCHAAYADSDDNDEHVRSAFLFADRKDWSNAQAHAAQSHNPVLIKLINWEYALDPDSGAGHDEIMQFMQANPDWPDQKRLRIRAELALRRSAEFDQDIITEFKEQPPITGVGKMALAEALMRGGKTPQEKITTLIRDAWRGGDFDEIQEQQIIDTYGNLLKRTDDIDRIDRLLWEEKITGAKRILDRVPADYRKLYQARMSLIADKRSAILSVAQVPAALKHDPGLIYDRMRYRARRDDTKGVREMLLAAPSHVPYPEKWWRQRELQVREAIGENNFKLAKKLLANHGQSDGGTLADALWLQGWLDTEFLKEPKTGYDLFYRMFSEVRFPVSKARAAYWAARAAEKAGDKEAAASWYTTASAYPTTFYGQLASLKANGTAPLRLPAAPEISGEAQRVFDNEELTRAIKLCIAANQPDLAKKFINYLAENADDDTQAALASHFGNRIGQPALSVHAAKKAMQQRGVVVIEAGYPRVKTPTGLAVERPLALAITRQESEFDPHARSPSGALGMMQLMTATAKETARKDDVPFSAGQLGDPSYNMTLGSLYLARLIRNYDGSYIMAIAAYNAGPGNVRNWAGQFGTPGNRLDSAIDWIEKIPFTETRNYVQRVLENLQIYRHLESDVDAPKLKLGEDLAR